MKNAIQAAVLKTNPYWPFSFLNNVPYRLCVWAMRLAFRQMPEIKSAYIMRDINSPGWTAGSSDLDICVITEHLETDKEVVFLKRFWKKYKRLSRVFPFIAYRFGSLPVCDTRQLVYPDFIFGTKGFSTVSFAEWRLFYGSEIRDMVSKNTAGRNHIGLLPDPDCQRSVFKYLLMPFLKGNLPCGTYARRTYKVIYKNLQYIYIKENKTCADSTAQLFDYFRAKKDFAADNLLNAMGESEKNAHFFDTPKHAADFLLTGIYGTMRLFDRYFSSLPLDGVPLSDGRIKEYSSQAKASVRATMPEEINRLAEETAKGNACVETIICCPGYHFMPFEAKGLKCGSYEIYIVVKEGATLSDFKILINSVKSITRRDNLTNPCSLDGYMVEPFVCSRNILLGQEYTMGATYFALHPFHLRRYGVCLYGDDILLDLKMPTEYLLRLAMARDLSAMSFRHLRIYLSDLCLGRPLMMLQNRIYTVLSYRLFAEKNIIATLSKEILDNYSDNFSQEPLTQDIKTIGELTHDSRVSEKFLVKYYFTMKSLLEKVPLFAGGKGLP